MPAAAQSHRLPCLPLIANDPYFSVWCAADRLTDADTSHWCGQRKRLRGVLRVDGQAWRFLGAGEEAAMDTVSLQVTATATVNIFEKDGVRLRVRFVSPLLCDDPDLLSTSVTLVDFMVETTDGVPRQGEIIFTVFDDLCYDGEKRPALMHDSFGEGNLAISYLGQRRQNILCHSSDMITIDWGYLYLAGEGQIAPTEEGLQAQLLFSTAKKAAHARLMVGYDDVASINYFGYLARAWYARQGKNMRQALVEMHAQYDDILARCQAFDRQLHKQAVRRGGEDYAFICAAAYRQSVAAHKLIADEAGNMVLLSKENGSNGCTGTVDVSYPSSPLFLKYNPDLVVAMCRPVLRFALLPVWEYGFAPHDVGRYPHATGQVYSHRKREAWQGAGDGDLYPAFYQYPAGMDCYDERYQMPVEECGNMLAMLGAAAHFGAKVTMDKNEKALLEKWAAFLQQYGQDPQNQLCTDDFAGHMARNVNLSAKAIAGLACYARLLAAWGKKSKADAYGKLAHKMIKTWRAMAKGAEGTALSFDGTGWSIKYNLAWDKVIGLGLLDDDFYQAEIGHYLKRVNKYGIPLDSRAAYTKSDWILWVASMTDDMDSFRQLVSPVARYLRETPSRVPFSDFYDTQSGKFVEFIARSVQGGVFMPLL